MSKMNCERAVEILFGAATPDAIERRALDQHLRECSDCADFQSRLESEEVDLLAEVLAQTTASGCERAADQIFAVGGEEPPEILGTHLQRCEHCRALIRARDRTLGVLPQLAVLDPGDVFTARVLARTRVESRSRHWMEYPVEWAYGIAVAIALLMLIPNSPLQGTSQELLSWLRGGEGESPRGAGWAQATVIPLSMFPVEAVREGTRIGGELETETGERATQVSWAFDSFGGHFLDLGGALTERDWEELRPLWREMQCDVRLVWRGIRGQLQAETDRNC